MKKVMFVDLNKRLVNKVKKLDLPIEVKCGDIFAEKGVIVTASNPNFTMGGGLDALIAKKYPKECKEVQKTPGKNKRIGAVIFTITVDAKLKSNSKLVMKALRFAKKNQKKGETLLISGLGTGIGGLSYKKFTKCLSKVFGVKAKKTPKNVVTRYKFMREGLKSQYGKKTWKIGKWEHEDKIGLCDCGFHASEKICDAFSYVQGEVLAIVECGGENELDDNGTKEVFQDMRVVKAYKWTQVDSVKLAIFAAEQVVNIYQEAYPYDTRPMGAIIAAKKWINTPTKDAAYAAADAAYAAADAARAAYAAADAAADAAYAAADAAYAAADAARAAAYAARAAAYAARAAADANAKEKIEKWLVNHLKELEEIK